MSSKFYFTLELHSAQSQVSIPAFLGDTLRELHISFSDGGKPFALPDGYLVMLSIKRPTGTHLEEFCRIEKNAVVVYPFSQNENTCAVEGIHSCDLTVYDAEGKKVGSPCFCLIVNEKAISRDDIELTDEDFTAVDAMIREEGDRQKSEALRAVAETSRATAEQERIKNEEARAEAEAKRNADTEEVKEILGNVGDMDAALDAILAIQGKLAEGNVIPDPLRDDVDAIAEKVTANSKRITNIENGYVNDSFLTVSGCDSIEVPSNALSYAEINKVSAADSINSYKVEGKKVVVETEEPIPDLDCPYVKDCDYDSNFADKITVEKLEDGSFKINGWTDDGSGRPFLFISEVPFHNGEWGENANYGLLCYEIVSYSGSQKPSIVVTVGTNKAMTEEPSKIQFDLGADIGIEIYKDNAVTDLIIKFKGKEVDADYEAGYETVVTKELVDTFAIPEEVTSLKQYSMGEAYVHLDNGVYIKMDGETINVREHIGYDNFIEVVPDGVIELNGNCEITFMLKGES